MAENTVSNVTSKVNENNLIHVDFLNESTPVVSSLDVARHFQKKHKDVLRAIDVICAQLPEIFAKRNFAPNEKVTENRAFFGPRKERYYQLTRDAFSLLAMGFTGSAAIRWKLKYIEAFNALERAVLENAEEDRKLAYEVGFANGKSEGRAGALAEVLAAEEAARAEAADAMLALPPKRRETLRKALRYAKMGLSNRDIAKLMDGNRRQIGQLLSLARKNGLLGAAKPVPANFLPVQGSLFTLNDRKGA